MLNFQQHIPIKAIFARIRGNHLFWPRCISIVIYKGPTAAWPAVEMTAAHVILCQLSRIAKIVVMGIF